jgi:adenylosuccinate lyase
MNTRTHETRSPLARFGRRFAAIVAEMNRAQNDLASARNTPERY